MSIRLNDQTVPSFEGLQGVWGNKRTLAKYQREQGNMSLFLGNRGTKLYKLEDENMVSKFIKRRTNKENVWEHGAILEGNSGTRTPHGRPSPLWNCRFKAVGWPG